MDLGCSLEANFISVYPYLFGSKQGGQHFLTEFVLRRQFLRWKKNGERPCLMVYSRFGQFMTESGKARARTRCIAGPLSSQYVPAKGAVHKLKFVFCLWKKAVPQNGQLSRIPACHGSCRFSNWAKRWCSLGNGRRMLSLFDSRTFFASTDKAERTATFLLLHYQSERPL